MTTPLNVLIVEDRTADAKLMLAELRQAGFESHWCRVDTEADYLAHLEPVPDLVLSDYSLPQFDALRALELLRERGLDIPFIIVSGAIGEDVAVQTIHAGADDYLLKDRLGRLGVAVTRALERKRLRDSSRRAEAVSRASAESHQRAAALTQAIVDALPAHLALLDPHGTIVAVNEAWRRFGIANGFPGSDCGVGTNYLEVCRKAHAAGSQEAGAAGAGICSVLEGNRRGFKLEYPCSAPREGRWFQMIVTPLGPDQGGGVVIMHLDITERRRAEELVQRSEERYRTLLNRIPDPLFVYDRETLVCLTVNDAAVTDYGYSRGEFLRMKITDLCLPEDTAVLQENLGKESILAEQTVARRHRKKDGTYIDVDITTHTLTLSGQLANIALARDVTKQRRAEAAVRASERFAHGILNSLLYEIIVVEADGTILAVNQAWRDSAARSIRLAGRNSAEGANYFQVCAAIQERSPEDETAFAAGLRDVLSGRCASFRMEYARFREPLPCWFVGRVTPFADDGHRGAVIVHIDVTQYRRAEDALLESEQRLQSVLDSSKAVAYLKDLEGRYLLVNRQWAELFSQSKEAGLGKTDYEIFPLEFAETFRANDREALNAGKAIELLETAPHPDGTHTYLSIKVPIYDAQGNAYATCGISTDITARLAAEEALRRSEEQFRGAFDAAAAGMALIAADGRFLQVNHSLCTITGYSEDELLATSFQAITHPDDLAENLDLLKQALDGTLPSYQLEKRYVHKEGPIVWVLASVAVVHDDQGRPIHFVSMVEDITLRKRAEETLKRYADRVTNLHRLDQAILATHRPRHIASEALSYLRALVPCWNITLFLFDRRQQCLRVLASEGAACPLMANTVMSLTNFGIKKLAALGRGKTFDVPDVHRLRNPSPLTQILMAEGLCAFTLVPLIAEGRLIGKLRLSRNQPGRLDANEMEVAREVADQLAIAIRHAQLFQQVRRGRRRLAELSNRLITTQEAERRHLARELHDEIGQVLTALKINLQAIAVADSASREALVQEGCQTVHHLIGQVRNLSLDLRPSMLDDFGLVSALRWFVDRMALRSKLEVKLSENLGPARLPAAIETACFRIAQEALTNAARYASARHVWVQLSRDPSELTLIVQDDGVGFDVSLMEKRAAQGTGLGLLGMRERAALLGGHITISSTAGEGTDIRLTLPLPLTQLPQSR